METSQWKLLAKSSSSMLFCIVVSGILVPAAFHQSFRRGSPDAFMSMVGHYWFCKKRWFCFRDSQCQRVEETDVIFLVAAQGLISGRKADMVTLFHVVHQFAWAKFWTIIRIPKKYADKFKNRSLKYFRARFVTKNLFDFLQKQNKFPYMSRSFPGFLRVATVGWFLLVVAGWQ